MKKTNNSRILLDLSSIAVYRTSSMHHIDLILLKENTLRVTNIINTDTCMYKQTGSTCITR